MANCKRCETFTKKSRSTIWGRSACQVLGRAVACRSSSSWTRAGAGASTRPNCTTLNDYLPYNAKKPHVQLETFFDRLCATGEFELRYALKAEDQRSWKCSPTDDQHPVKYVCKQGDEVRALVKEKDSGWNETDGDRKWEEEVWRWRSVANNKLGEITDQPAACPILDAQEDLPEEMREGRHSPESDLWKIRSGRNIVRARQMERPGGPLVVRAWPGTEADCGGGLLGATRDARWKPSGGCDARPLSRHAGEN